MIEGDPIKNDARRSKQERRVGKGARCAQCGIGNFETLRPVKASLIESHHVVGRANDSDLVVPLCKNCHALATEKLAQVGASMNPPNTVLHKLVEVLKALGAFFTDLGGKCIEWSAEVARLITGLNNQHPTWVEMPEAQS